MVPVVVTSAVSIIILHSILSVCSLSPPFLSLSHSLSPIADQAPTIIAPPVSQAYLLHDTAYISCLAASEPAPTYQWFFNNIEIEGENSPNLIIYPIKPENRGVYHCIATNRAGSDESKKAQVSIKGKTYHIIV